MDDEVEIVWTSQGIAALGTYSPAFAAEAWRLHLEQHVPVDEHKANRLDELDWLRGSRRWIVVDSGRATVYPKESVAPKGARPALVLLSTFTGRRSLLQ